MSNINTMIKWMSDRQGRVSYSMNSRLGPNSYDCSSAVYNALIAGGFLPAGSMGNTDTLFGHLEKAGWQQVKPDASGNYPAKRGDVFIWGNRGGSGGAAGHTGIFIDDNDNMIHCNAGFDGITINDHDYIWNYNGCPEVTIYRYTGSGGGQVPNPPQNTPKPQEQKPSGLNPMSGVFYPNTTLPVSADTNPDDAASPALDYYKAGMAIKYDSYIMANGYAWISYVASSNKRRYVAVGPDDGQTDTTWGTGFFN